MCSVVCLVLPTSNHNCWCTSPTDKRLYVLSFLHQTTTLPSPSNLNVSCMSCPSYIKPQLNGNTGQAETRCMSCPSYIKPQLKRDTLGKGSVVCLVLPTSNHNLLNLCVVCVGLYVLSFLHQTTTCNVRHLRQTRCMSCPSYIKPQLILAFKNIPHVVCLVLPTSNHNFTCLFQNLLKVVCLVLPTSNHNYKVIIDAFTELYVLSFLHQTTTLSNLTS